MPRFLLHLAAVIGAVVIGVTLRLWGQPLICACGYVDFWVGSIHSPQNSQQIADRYTLSQIVHGMLIVLGWRLLFPGLGLAAPYATAIVTGVGWELLEHTDWVLQQFRVTTLYQGYLGDSVVNYVSDYLWMLGGFFLARAVTTVWVIVFIAGLELTAALVARDSLVLTTLMLVYPIEAIESWQQELNRRANEAD